MNFFLTTAYKLNTIKLKLATASDIFFTFIESMEMILSQYKETCEILLDDPKLGGYDIKDLIKNAIGNLLHANIGFHSRRLIAEFPGDGVK